MTCYKIYDNFIASADAAAQLDIRQDGIIVGVLGVLQMDVGAGDAQLRVELSFSSSSGFTTNDTNQSFFGMALNCKFDTAAGHSGGHQGHLYVPLNLAVEGGERLYLHEEVIFAPIDARFTGWLYVEDKASRASLSRRRL